MSPRMLNKTCTISREAVTQSSVTGEIVRTYSQLATAVRCSVHVAKADRFSGYPEAGETIYNVYFAYGQDVGTGDLITAITGLTNVSLTVESSGTDGAGRSAYTHARCIHRMGGGA